MHRLLSLVALVRQQQGQHPDAYYRLLRPRMKPNAYQKLLRRADAGGYITVHNTGDSNRFYYDADGEVRYHRIPYKHRTVTLGPNWVLAERTKPALDDTDLLTLDEWPYDREWVITYSELRSLVAAYGYARMPKWELIETLECLMSYATERPLVDKRGREYPVLDRRGTDGRRRLVLPPRYHFPEEG